MHVNHAEMVAALAKPGADIVNELSPLSAHLWHMASCVCGEGGELFDAIKRSAIYGKELDHENVIEELGDLEFYLEGLRQGLGISREETINNNIEKLSERYGQSYSNQAAIDRSDKAK